MGFPFQNYLTDTSCLFLGNLKSIAIRKKDGYKGVLDRRCNAGIAGRECNIQPLACECMKQQ